MEGEQRIRYVEGLAKILKASQSHLDSEAREKINDAVMTMKEEIILRYGVAAWELIERGAVRLASQ